MAAPIAMERSRDDGREIVRQHSGWLVPLAVFLVTAGLCALFLLYYLGPSPTSLIETHAAPTVRTAPVPLRVGSLKLVVPANYILYAKDRQGGARKDLALLALLPDFRGYSAAEAPAYNDHSADSPVVNILIREENLNLTEGERLNRIYMAYVADPQGHPGPFGLTQYTFRDDSGYRDEDLFVGELHGKPVAMRCWHFSPDMPAPNCLRDKRLKRGVAMTIRFKRANLGQWREIATGVDALVAGFEKRAG